MTNARSQGSYRGWPAASLKARMLKPVMLGLGPRAARRTLCGAKKQLSARGGLLAQPRVLLDGARRRTLWEAWWPIELPAMGHNWVFRRGGLQERASLVRGCRRRNKVAQYFRRPGAHGPLR